MSEHNLLMGANIYYENNNSLSANNSNQWFLLQVDNMARHVITVCIFCLICATHTPCDSHAAMVHEDHSTLYHTDIKSVSREKFKMKEPWENRVLGSNSRAPLHSVNKRDSNSINSIDSKDIYLKKLFTKFGDGKSITMDGFRNLFDHLVTLQETHKDASNDTVNFRSFNFSYIILNIYILF